MSGDNRPRIVFLNHWAARLGGAEYSLLDLMAYAVEQGECHLVTAEEGALIDRARALGVECHVVACGGNPGAVRRWHLLRTLLLNWREVLCFLRHVGRLGRLVRTLAPDLLHANVPKSHVALSLLSAAGWSGPRCYHIREIFPSRSLSRLVYRVMLRGRMCRILAISHAVKRALPGRAAERATVIHNGVAMPATVTRRTNTSCLRLLYLGRVVPWKGCHHLVAMAQRLAGRYGEERFTLDIVGGTLYWPHEYRDDLQARIAATGLGDRCRLHPHTTDPASVYACHDLFCNASYQEPFGRTVAEAQAHGLPVVSFDSGGIGEIVEQARTGLLVPEGDVDALADAVSRFLDDAPLVSAMGEEGRRRAERLFDRTKQGPALSLRLIRWATPGRA
jgi:glycosyltransferase involved in cell wall biosynthesis